MKNHKKIFIGCAITKYLTKEGLNEEFEKFIKEIYSICKKYTDHVFLALEREDFGRATMEDHVCTPLDYEAMKESDYFIALPEDSMGVAVEIGWASALRKKIVVIQDDRFTYSPLINAIGTITEAKVIKFKSQEGIGSMIKEIILRLDEYLSYHFS